MTQEQTILNMLKEKEWVCTSEMYAQYIADPRTLLAKLKKKKIVDSRWCKSHNHKGQMKEWTKLYQPENDCCYSFHHFGTHTKDCAVYEQMERQARILEQETERNLKLI